MMDLGLAYFHGVSNQKLVYLMAGSENLNFLIMANYLFREEIQPFYPLALMFLPSTKEPIARPK